MAERILINIKEIKMAKLVLVNLDMNQNQLLQAVMQAGDPPANPIAGQFYYDSTKKHAYVYNGTAWELMGNIASVVDADFNASSTNAIQNKAVSTGLVKTFEKTIDSTSYTLDGKAFDGTQLTSAIIPSATTSQAGLMSASDKQSLNKINNKADASKAIGELTISDGTTISWTAVDGSSPKPNNIIIPNATTTTAGAMSAADKTKLEGLKNVDGLTYTSGTTGVDTAIKSGATNLATGTIPSASNSAYGVTKLDASVTQNGANPVTGKAIYDYVGDAIAASDAMIFKGTIGTGGTVTALPTTYKTGWTYRVITAGTYAGQKCEVGDLIIALIDRNGTGNLDSDWTVAQTNIDGAITDISATTPITVSGSGTSRTIGHTNSGVTAGFYGLPSNTTPAFGDTFNVPYVTVDEKGHTTKAETHTVKIPNDVATDRKAGLMSANDKEFLDTAYMRMVFRITAQIPVGDTSVTLGMSSAEDTLISVQAYVGSEEVIVDVNDTGDNGEVVVSIARPHTSAIDVVVIFANLEQQ